MTLQTLTGNVIPELAVSSGMFCFMGKERFVEICIDKAAMEH